MVAASMYRSPGTSRRRASCARSPRASTTATPAIDSSAPSNCGRVTAESKNSRPSAIIHSGMLAATSVTFSAVEVCSARYCSALYRPTPSRPSSAKRRQCAYSPLPGRSTQPPSGSNSTNASSQRRKFSVSGGTRSTTSRPTTALPAHSRGGKVNKAAVAGVRRGVVMGRL